MKKIALLIFILHSNITYGQWTQQILSEPVGPLIDIYLFNADTVCIVGQFMRALYTSNGGTNWVNYGPENSNDWFTNVDFTDSQTGYACTLTGSIFKTTNGGLSWTQVGSDLQPLYSIDFINQTTGYAVGISGSLLKTIDSGANWSYVLNISNQQLIQIYFFNSTLGFIVASGGAIYRTSNGGLSWDLQTSNTTQSLTSVHFADANVGWAIGENGNIIKTIDGGSNWSPQNSNTTLALAGVFAVNSSTAYVVGDLGTILYTNNGGATWTPQASGTTNILSEVKFSDNNIGYIIGAWGTILKTTNAGLNIDDVSLSKSVSFPNPFSDAFTIKIESQTILSEAEVSIYDAIGNKVYFIDGLKQNEILIERKNLSSGIYFYNLKENGKLIAKGKIIAE